jgi:cyclic beta-1,2-glucan synthetase
MLDNNPTKDPDTQEAHPIQEVAIGSPEDDAYRFAKEHKVQSGTSHSFDLYNQLKQQAAYLDEAYREFQTSDDKDIPASYAGEWILDNYYIIQRSLRQIREDLPPNYYRQLPKLINTTLAGFPRVYAIAAELTKARDASLDMDHVENYLKAYQQVAPLNIGEIWAIPTMLRLCLVEMLVLAIADILRNEPPIVDDHADILQLQLEPDTITAHCITSLRAIEHYEWNDFFDRTNLVEGILATDPAEVYSQMDFESRDRYRKVVESLALLLDQQETAVAQAVVSLAERSSHSSSDSMWSQHVGYWLIGSGYTQLRETLGYSPKSLERAGNWLRSHPTPTYVGGVILLAGIIILLWFNYAQNQAANPGQLILVLLLTFIPAFTISSSILNWVFTRFRKPHILPKLDFSEEIPVNCSTLVVIPAMISSIGDIDNLVRQMEIHFLQNGGANIHFGLLTDFPDADEQQRPEDEELIQAIIERVDRLNDKYKTNEDCSFFLLHRERRWNESMKTWMGWERKRGKLEELNRLIIEKDETSFTVKVGPLQILPSIQYVITLDADTVLTRGSARRLIGCMAHPLNQPVFDPSTDQVIDGYTILQPRTEVRPVSANYSWFTRIFAGDAGLDLYSRAVSDLYQDWFGEGTFVGKGIYDVRAFWRSIANKVPENTLLSHDLFEGIQGRAGLVTDTVLYEDYPPTYLSYANRMHRWMRGDWQLLPWLLNPARDNTTRKSTFKPIDRWKILDNLRRSLLAPAILLLLIASWFWLPGNTTTWMLFALITPAVPIITDILGGVISGISKVTRENFFQNLKRQFIHWLLVIIFLPFEALLALDAILVTLVRVYVTQRDLLQWIPAAKTAILSLGIGRKAATVWFEMLNSLLLTIMLAILVIIFNFKVGTLLLLILWGIAPYVGYTISRPVQKARQELSDTQLAQLHRLARRTWLFFEQFVNPDDHWLPPDHFQESPLGQIAHRTSPTNIGLMLTSTLGARDLGYISLDELVLRVQNAFETIDQLEKYQGHLLNWYDTRSLEPLPPRYVSTVDSGNFVGSLIALRQGFIELSHSPVLQWERWSGFIDTLDVLDEIIKPSYPAAPEITSKVQRELKQMKERVLAVKERPDQWGRPIENLKTESLVSLEKALLELVEADIETIEVTTLQSLRMWSDRLRYYLHYLEYEYQSYVPWIFALRLPPTIISDSGWQSVIAAKWQALIAALPMTTSLEGIPAATHLALKCLSDLQNLLIDTEATPQTKEDGLNWCLALEKELIQAAETSERALANITKIVDQCEVWIGETNFGFLFNPRRHIFRIGYNVDTGNRDQNYYDLLASEARVASLIAIGKREVPQSHWLHLGRPLTRIGNLRTILSWSGTMFEYLMPVLHTVQYDNTLLTQSCYAAVQRQIEYGREKGVPWGISESGYYHFDAQDNYQYRAFGVPGLGLKRGLEDDLVITPYASILALSLEPQAVLDNIDELSNQNLLCDYGFYEAIDFTTRRLPRGQEKGIVKSFMSHHQGMILLSLVNFLHGNQMVKRFHADERIQSAELLLQEQIPTFTPIQIAMEEDVETPTVVDGSGRVEPWSVPTRTPYPQAHYLSNGSFGSMITNNGSGFLKWEDYDLTRWRADSTRDPFGMWIYFQEDEDGDIWSITDQPAQSDVETDQMSFSPFQVERICSKGDLITHMSVAIPPDDDIEIRRIRITNRSDRIRTVRVTSYAEVILAAQSGDRRHPVFNTLFIESDYIEEIHGLHFTRRARSPRENPVHLVHSLYSQNGQNGPISFESDRKDFLGRGGTPRLPQGLFKENYSGKTGHVLHPIMSLGKVIQLKPQSTIHLAYLTAAAPTRQQAISLSKRYRDSTFIQRAFDRARSASELEVRRMDLNATDLRNIQQLLSLMFYPQRTLRAAPEILSENRKGQPSLWPYSISGDFPILLVNIRSEDEMPLVTELLHAHAYWRSRKIKIDLVILNEKESGYSQEIQSQLNRLMSRTKSDVWRNQRGGIFILQRDKVNEEDLKMLYASALAILDGGQGAVDTQLRNIFEMPTTLPGLMPVVSIGTEDTKPVERPSNLLFDNGIGGFTPDGKEYSIFLQPGQSTPAPWSNIIANDQFGFLITERGGGCSWSENSGENRISPWSNDPISDPPGEALYIRDEETSIVWSPLPFIQEADTPYHVRHGCGYTIFEHNQYGLEQELRLFVAPDEPIKFAHLKIHNVWQRPRRITVTYYLEWVLGVNRDEMQQYIILDHHSDSGALLARNPFNPEFGERVAFLATDKPVHGLTANRTEFLGIKGSIEEPAALRRIGLSGSVKTGADPCAVLQVHLDLPPGASDDVFFIIGQGENQDQTVQLIERNRQRYRADEVFNQVVKFWDQTLNAVQVETPDDGMNLILNRWLLYQNLACRVWGRSAFYQSSGAYGFRDQLQDTMALIHAKPEVARAHILRAARHQFEEGDVLHWWHPPSGRGVRTRITDDLLWLPYVVAEYVSTTGDESILSEEVPFLRGKSLERGEEERYNLWETTTETYPILEHCHRAIRKGSTKGRHDIPLIGAGDWNDGMNRVGIDGLGESVWLGWFLYSTLSSFADISDRVGDDTKASEYRQKASELAEAIETHAWNGDWYLRGYYDDGTPLGAAGNMECKIDSIAQSWSVLSGGGNAQRAQKAMQAVAENLIKKEDQLVLLFTPPFDKSPRDPGYIKGYPPGIRENGGQYTHAATWTVWAFTKLGDGDRAWKLFDLMNPIKHSDNAEKIERYKVEPFVIAADVYSQPPYIGRGGWTWYTGSGGWMYRLGLEAILGFHREGHLLKIEPCIPKEWPGYKIQYQFGESQYTIQVENPEGVNQGVVQILMDGMPSTEKAIKLNDDGINHQITIIMGDEKASQR